MAGKVIKCPGRFKELREFMHNEAVPLVLEERTTVTEDDLIEVWGLIQNDVFSFDVQDPYFASAVDNGRKQPDVDYLSLAPLFPSTFHLDDELVAKYALSMGNGGSISRVLGKMAHQPGRFFRSDLKRDPSRVMLPGGSNLAGYAISANFGIGTASSGGVGGSGIRSDSPFLLEVYKVDPRSHEQDLAAVIGFWAQDNDMLVSQMQSCKNAQYPTGVKFGVASLKVAETAAREMGFDRVVAYSAREHPIFKEHPENWRQLGPDFVCMWDNSARTLHYEPTNGRNGLYVLELK